jgi:hypothetical protein
MVDPGSQGSGAQPTDARDGMEALDRLARQRRADAEAAAEKPRPDFVTSVQYSEVVYTFRRGAIPFTLIDPSVLSRGLHERFALSPGAQDLGPLLKKMSPNALAQLSEEEILRRLVQADNALLGFAAGKYPIRHGFVPIAKVSMNFESVMVGVEGVSAVAEVIAKEIAELAWSAAGAARRWEDISPAQELVSFGTATRVQLPFPLEHFMAQALQRFLKSEVVGGSNFAGYMGPQSRHNEFQPSRANVASATMDELHIQVNRFDTQTGYPYQALVQFSVTARSDHGTGRVLVSSHMHYDRHVEFLQTLLEEFERDRRD